MKNTTRVKAVLRAAGIIAIAAVIGISMTACPTEGGGGDGTGKEENLPASKGANAVSGKMYYERLDRTVFSVTADGAKSGTYVVYRVDNGTYNPGDKFTYTTQIQTGTYSWNENAKTVTLKPEKVASLRGGYSGGGGNWEVEYEYKPLQDRTGFRSELQAELNDWIAEEGQEAINKELSEEGFSSVAALLDYLVNEEFGDKTCGYSFSADGNALFLEDALPANKGTNELSGQTYYALTWDENDNEVRDEYIKYVFTASGYTYTISYDGTVSRTVTGSYAYDSTRKIVWLNMSTIDGKNRAEYYAEQTADSGHNYPDDNVYRAAETNDRFYYTGGRYNSTNKTIDD